MKSWLVTTLALFGSAFVLGCDDSSAGSGTAVVTQAQNGGSITVAAGETVTVQLAGNPTTGYEWAVAQADPIRLSLVEVSHVPDSSAIGSGGLTTFRFRANLAGSSPLVLAYRRSWERTSADATFSLSVAIHDGQGRLPDAE